MKKIINSLDIDVLIFAFIYVIIGLVGSLVKINVPSEEGWPIALGIFSLLAIISFSILLKRREEALDSFSEMFQALSFFG
ncbi:MAG: hypothetical protein NT165_02970 [Candidatus Falkowbacteria bacterium]|nr:hypothetical protein [Candidatus Falkowbacteria bacterium]